MNQHIIQSLSNIKDKISALIHKSNLLELENKQLKQKIGLLQQEVENFKKNQHIQEDKNLSEKVIFTANLANIDKQNMAEKIDYYIVELDKIIKSIQTQ